MLGQQVYPRLPSPRAKGDPPPKLDLTCMAWGDTPSPHQGREWVGGVSLKPGSLIGLAEGGMPNATILNGISNSSVESMFPLPPPPPPRVFLSWPFAKQTEAGLGWPNLLTRKPDNPP